ncbi:MAG: hypothetical protein FJ095_00380 [Deltaproteobacteria bacterium]|nr:hypothetical protein [Deltaproteobacteria bacterium]
MTDDNQDDTTKTSAERPRRVRRTSTVERDASPDATDAGTTASSSVEPQPSPRPRPRPRSAEGRSPERRGPERPAGRRPGRPAGRPEGPERRDARPGGQQGSLLSAIAVNRSSKKTIYRQDVVGTPPVMPPREAKPDAKKTPDQLMLVWHPAPKALAPAVKKESKPLTAKEALAARHARANEPKRDAAKPSATVAIGPEHVRVTADQAFDVARLVGDAGEALVQAWLDAGNTAAIARIAARDDAPSSSRKAARRALNVLKARGVSLEVTPVVTPKHVDEPSDCVASFIPPDGNGTTFYSFSQRLPGGRFRVADVMVNEATGVVHASLGHLAGKHIRRWKARVEESFGLPPIPVPLEWARHAVAEGRRRNEAAKQIVPLAFDSCLVLAGPAPADQPTHPVADLLAKQATDEERAAAVLDSDKLHAEPEFAAWVAERSALSELVSKVGERLTGAEAEDRAAVDKALDEETSAATDRWFSPERREQVAVRLCDTAVAVRVRRGDDAARRILALAEAIRRAGLVTNPPRDFPFLRAFFQKGVARMARENQRVGAPPANG